jgi:hypothetical protein
MATTANAEEGLGSAVRTHQRQTHDDIDIIGADIQLNLAHQASVQRESKVNSLGIRWERLAMSLH